jgi:hypothetical protein
MYTKVILTIATLVSVSANADLGSKAPLKADFRGLIDSSYSERTSLANGVNQDIAQDTKTKADKAKKNDSQRVTDFVDVEIGWGEAPAMVDRRFDSVSEPVVADKVQTTDADELKN